MIYLKEFGKHSDYESEFDELKLPGVYTCKEEEHVHYKGEIKMIKIILMGNEVEIPSGLKPKDMSMDLLFEKTNDWWKVCDINKPYINGHEYHVRPDVMINVDGEAEEFSIILPGVITNKMSDSYEWMEISEGEIAEKNRLYSRGLTTHTYDMVEGEFHTLTLSDGFTFGEQGYEIEPDYHTPGYVRDIKPSQVTDALVSKIRKI